MANKPDKFGIKFWMLEDDTKYLCNAFPYLEKDELRSANESLPEGIVIRLMSPYLNKGRNVTTDRLFTTASHARTLKAKDTNIVGMISHTLREIPAVLAIERAPLHETTLLRNGDGGTLTVYQGNVNKNVLLLSMLHITIAIRTNRKKFPGTVQFYSVESIFLTKWLADTVQEQQHVGGLSMFSITC
jgi:hypothetical protein